MKIEFDAVKSERNARERGLPFGLVEAFEWESAVLSEDGRFPYAETRFNALGFIRNRLHVVCFTAIAGGVRIISFRKANEREVHRYEKEKAAGR
ncbi:MAG TPA: BrnT family toxin [Rhizomicrobium sp.]|nr:BrnT family toxin [Rhizomicrobium sp.]